MKRMSNPVHIVCPYCHGTNRVLRERRQAALIAGFLEVVREMTPAGAQMI